MRRDKECPFTGGVTSSERQSLEEGAGKRCAECSSKSEFNTNFRLHQDSRRDQEEGGGAGPSGQPRRDHEQGGGAGLRKLDFFRFGLFGLTSSTTNIVLVTLPKHGS